MTGRRIVLGGLVTAAKSVPHHGSSTSRHAAIPLVAEIPKRTWLTASPPPVPLLPLPDLEVKVRVYERYGGVMTGAHYVYVERVTRDRLHHPAAVVPRLVAPTSTTKGSILVQLMPAAVPV